MRGKKGAVTQSLNEILSLRWVTAAVNVLRWHPLTFGDRHRKLCFNLTNTGWAGDVISVRRSPMISRPTKISPFSSASARSDGRFSSHFPSADEVTATTGSQIATGFAPLRNTRQQYGTGSPSTTSTRLSPSLMVAGNFAPCSSECHAQSGFRQHAEVWIAFFHAENRCAAHTVSGLRMMSLCFSQNAFSCALCA